MVDGGTQVKETGEVGKIEFYSFSEHELSLKLNEVDICIIIYVDWGVPSR